MKCFRATSLLLGILFVPAVVLAQGQLVAEVEPMADKIDCPSLDGLEWGIAQSFPDPWYSDSEVTTGPWYPGYHPSAFGPYTTTAMGKEMLACRWADHERRGSLRVQRPWADIPEEDYPCPPTVQVKVLSSLPAPWLGTFYTWRLITKHSGAYNSINYCHYEGRIPNEILRPVETGPRRTPNYPDLSANPPESIDDFKQAFAVTEAELTAIPAQKTTTCPTMVRFEGRIHVNGSGQIRYRVEENGQVGPLKTIYANATGGYALAWQSEVDAPQESAAAGGLTTAPQPGNVATGRARLLIESPSDGITESNDASYEITCSPLAPMGGLAQTPEDEPESEKVRLAVARAGADAQAEPQPKPGLPGRLVTTRAPEVTALPDLRIRAAAVDPSNPKNVKVEVVNTGAAASAATGVRLWITPQGKVWHGSVPPLAAGKSVWITVQADMPVMAAQQVYARVDDPDKVKESNEGNNGHKLK